MQAPITVSTFYHFAPLEHPARHKPAVLARMQALGILGTITLAHEGINATISGMRDALDRFMAELAQELGLERIPARESHTVAQPFQRSKVKVKRELISLGATADPTVCVGDYVDPRDWNALITRADVITIDTRNDYEFQLGHFAGAINPGTRNFKQMVGFTAQNLDPKAATTIAMYCTGGIRCEKYSAYLLTQGFARIYHLRGGILAYLDAIPPAQSLWQGACFVFDERVSVG